MASELLYALVMHSIAYSAVAVTFTDGQRRAIDCMRPGSVCSKVVIVRLYESSRMKSGRMSMLIVLELRAGITLLIWSTLMKSVALLESTALHPAPAPAASASAASAALPSPDASRTCSW